MLIIVEGGDGSGKSTLVQKLKTFNFKIEKPAALNNRHQFEYYERLALQSIYNEENVILDRSFISELVYRVYDKKKPKLKLSEMFALLKYCKIILCETGTQFQDSLKRGEGFNPMDALEKNFRAKGLDKTEPELYKKIVKYNKLLTSSEKRSPALKYTAVAVCAALLLCGAYKLFEKHQSTSSI